MEEREDTNQCNKIQFPLKDLIFDQVISMRFSESPGYLYIRKMHRGPNTMYVKYLCSAAIFGCDTEERHHGYG